MAYGLKASSCHPLKESRLYYRSFSTYDIIILYRYCCTISTDHLGIVHVHNLVVRFNNHMISYIYEYSVMCSGGVNLGAEAPGFSENHVKKSSF